MSLGFSCLAQARINLPTTKKLVLPQKVGAESLADIFTVEILPDAVAPDETTQSFLTKMADNSISLYWKHSPLRHSAAGRAVETAEKKLNLEATYQGENQINHRFNLKLLAIQALAKFQYTGWVNAALNYDLKSARAAAEVTEELSDKKDLVLSHEMSSSEQKSAVSLKWKW